MALEITPGKLLEEVESAQDWRDKHLTALGEMIRATHGPHYSRSEGSVFASENNWYAYLNLMVPRLVYDNPRFRVRTRRPGVQLGVADAIRHGLNRWARDFGLATTLERLAYDFCYVWFACYVTSEPQPGKLADQAYLFDKAGIPEFGDSSVMWPSVYRIPPGQLLLDAQARHPREARIIGHEWECDHEDLILRARAKPDEGWNMKEIKNLSPGEDSLTDQRFGAEAYGSDQQPHNPDRERVKLKDLWIAELELPDSPGAEEGYHGTIVTIGHGGGNDGETGKGAFVRKPRPFYGPPSGPYIIQGAYQLPDKLYPLSPLVAIEGQTRELNRHARAWSRSAEHHKRVILYDERDTKTAMKIKKAKHDFFVGIPGFEKQKYAEAVIGGATREQTEAYAFLHDRLQRVSGMDDAQQGNVTGKGTATEHSIVDEATSTRSAFVKQRFTGGVVEICKKVAWYMFHDDRIVFPLGEEAADDLNMEDPLFVGGNQDPESEGTFEDLELEIEPYSLERTNQGEHLRRSIEVVDRVVAYGQAMPMMPWIDWGLVFDFLGDALNETRMSDMVDVEAAIAQGAAMQTDAKDQPRLWKDSGSTGDAGGASSSVKAQSGIGAQLPGLGTTPSAPTSGFEGNQSGAGAAQRTTGAGAPGRL